MAATHSATEDDAVAADEDDEDDTLLRLRCVSCVESLSYPYLLVQPEHQWYGRQTEVLI
jgi:hypothetical protein